MNENWLSQFAFTPCTAPFTNGSDNRSPEAYEKVIAQFDVENHPRYQPGARVTGVERTTFCNIFNNDATKAMGCEWLRLEQRGAVYEELDANAMIEWLLHRGERHGWNLTDNMSEAIVAANQGRPTAVYWYNRGGIGHMGMVLPSNTGVQIAQAGGSCFARAPLEAGFGTRAVKYAWHL